MLDLLTVEVLEESEVMTIESLIEELRERFNTVEQESFGDECQLAAHQMPLRLRRLFHDFRNRKIEDGYLLLKGFPLSDEAIGPTPPHWDAPWINERILREEIYQCLVSSCLGEIFGWLTQEKGRYLRHIVPIETDRNEQLGGSSNVVLLWHVEEAFHPQRADMMTIMCYRNNEEACTNICSTSDLEIPAHYWQVLSQRRFFIDPDKSHFPENNQSAHWQLDQESFAKIRQFLQSPEPVAVLTGKRGQENLLIDEAFMRAAPGDGEAQEALSWLFQHMNERKHEIIMEPGDLLVIDNRMTAHGRSQYVPQYGAKARWLRRVNITADLRKSFEWKMKPYGRTIL